MQFIDFETMTGIENMSKDEHLLNYAIENNLQEPIFRLYAWEPACISLGRNQDENFIDKELLKANNIDYVRRLTGGRALFHHKEITYSYVSSASIIPNGENISESYKYISGIWIDIFKELGIDLTIGGLPRHITKNNYCMSVSTGADLCWNGKKFIGSAQCRKNGYILQHGAIVLDYDKELIDNIFQEQTDFETIISLKQINPSLTKEDIINTTKKYINKLCDK